jgi:hypothetical protein
LHRKKYGISTNDIIINKLKILKMNTMILPNVIKEFVEAKNSHDSIAFAECFSETATVFDEENTYTGRKEIKSWIEASNAKYKMVAAPVNYSESGTKGILTAEISGTFDGSPVLLDYSFEIRDDKINRLEITLNTTA